MRSLLVPALAALALALLPGPSLADGDDGPVLPADKIRGAYFHHGHERGHLEDLQRHGINTLAVKFAPLSPDAPPEMVERLKLYARWAKELGLYFMPIVNLMGGSPERGALQASSRRETDASGAALAGTPCPLDDKFWDEVVVRRGHLIAELSRDHAIHAFLLDPEMYGADHTVFGPGCYCDGCWAEFFGSRGEPAPDVPAAGRAAHLEQAGEAEAYGQWQSEKAEAMARRAREAIHEVNPRLSLGVLLLDYPNWFMAAWARGFGTPELPVLAFSETTYSNGFSGYIAETLQRFRDQGAHVSLVPGLWLSQFLARELPGHLVRMALPTGGYWLYTTYSLDLPAEKLAGGYRLPQAREEYWQAIAAANQALSRALAEGEDAAPPLVRATAIERLRAQAQTEPGTPALVPLDEAGAAPPDPKARATRLRGRGRYYLLAEQGEELSLRLTGHQLGRYEDVPVYVLLGPDGEALAEGELPLGQPQGVKIAARARGLHTLHVLSRSNTFSASLGARHWVIDASGAVALCQFAARLYFHVPADTATFTLAVSGTGGAEGVLLKVFAPDGSVVAERDTDQGKGFSLPVQVPEGRRGAVWSLTLERPAKGIFEDATLALEGLPPYLSEDPGALLMPSPGAGG